MGVQDAESPIAACASTDDAPHAGSLAEAAQREDSREEAVRGLHAWWLPRSNASSGGMALPLLQRVLRARGMAGSLGMPEAQVQAFLAPSLLHLHNPSLLSNLDDAAQRLLHAARQGERIFIYGDYDVDGVSASAILYHTLRAVSHATDVRTYVPHRLEEGYGLSSGAMGELCDAGAKVIVSVDCGITALEPALVAKQRGVELIITDHHNFAHASAGDALLPEAFALVHPRLPGCDYPFQDLCGAGVAFKLAWRILTLANGGPRLPEGQRELLLDLLGLCSLGVIADVVPLVGENRVIARFGLRRLRSSRIEGLRALIAASGLDDQSVDEEQVGFQLAPRLNACGRMGHAREAVELLTTAAGDRAAELALQLSQQNQHRKRTELAIFEQACELAEREGMTGDARRAIVLRHEGWHAGVVGIVCSRLVEKYHRPAVLLAEHDGLCHGSGRSVDGVSLHAALARCASHLGKFGGHDMAAGMQCTSEQFAGFARQFVEVVNQMLPVGSLVARKQYDCEAVLHDLSVQEVRALDQLRPFGRDNPGIVLLLRGLRIASRPEHLGKTNKHMAMLLQDGDGAHAPGRGATLRSIAWGKGELVPQLRMGQRVDVLARPKLNTFQGSTRAELEVLDLAVS